MEFVNLLREATIVVDNARKPLNSATENARNVYPVLCRYPKPSFRESRLRRRQGKQSSSSRWESIPSTMNSSSCHPPKPSPSSSCSSYNHDPLTFFHVSAATPLRMPVRSHDDWDKQSSPTNHGNLIEYLDEALAISDGCLLPNNM